MRGYDVLTSDDRAVGRVIDVQNGFLIVESGRLRKSRHPIPREFVHAVDEAAKVVVTVPRRVLMDAPRVRQARELRPGFGSRALRPRPSPTIRRPIPAPEGREREHCGRVGRAPAISGLLGSGRSTRRRRLDRRGLVEAALGQPADDRLAGPSGRRPRRE